MDRQLFLDECAGLTIAAMTEDGQLAELHIERADEGFAGVGGLYVGKVCNVLNGMQAAFIDIGQGKNAYLSLADALPDENGVPRVMQGQKVPVQILKEAAGSKGARVTMRVALPGRYVVLQPYEPGVRVSAKIKDESERATLKALVRENIDKQMGVIVRTQAAQASSEELVAEIGQLTSDWEHLQKLAAQKEPPCRLPFAADPVAALIRDGFTAETTSVVAATPRLYALARELAPSQGEGRVSLYSKPLPLFDAYALTSKLNEAFRRVLHLKSGGSLVFDETEALTAIDVNSGGFVGGRDLGDTAFVLNTEAAGEIARQLRLRNIGGMVLIDFIDMPILEQRQEVLRVLKEALARDRVKSEVFGFTQLGLVELARRKLKRRLSAQAQTPCPRCGGAGRIDAPDWLAAQAIWAVKRAKAAGAAETLTLTVGEKLYALLQNSDAALGVYLRTGDTHGKAYALDVLGFDEITQLRQI